MYLMDTRRTTAVNRMTVALVSCVKTKRACPAPAQDLYISQLFRGLKAYAEHHADAWFILSAEHGLLRPDQIVAPYEKTLNTMAKPDRTAWAQRVGHQLLTALPADATVLMLAGQRYREHLVPLLGANGFLVSVPLAGMPLGEQLRRLGRYSSGNMQSISRGKP